MKPLSKWSLGVAVLMATITSTTFVKASSASSPSVASWLIYWDEKNVRPALRQYADRLETISLFAYQFSDSGSVVPGDPNLTTLRDELLQLPLSQRPRFLITIVNDVRNGTAVKLKDPQIVHNAIATPEARERHVQELVAIAAQADGLDIDYEKVMFEDAAAFQSFIQELSTALHAQKKFLSVVVQPRSDEALTPGIQKNGAATIDWGAIAPYVDRITVMAYLYHFQSGPPGSIAPTSWISQIATFGLKRVPPEKLSIALHLGGIDWPQGKPGKSIEYLPATALAASHSTKLRNDAATDSATFAYEDETGKHEVWIETGDGIRRKINALRALGVKSVALWRLGSGDPALWDHIPRH